jgi:hypothetical protein
MVDAFDSVTGIENTIFPLTGRQTGRGVILLLPASQKRMPQEGK